MLFALSTEVGSGEPYVIACAKTPRGLVQALMPYLLQCCDPTRLFSRTVAEVERVIATGEWQAEVFVPDSDEKDKSGVSFLLQCGTPEMSE